jgi:hypothetical protein
MAAGIAADTIVVVVVGAVVVDKTAVDRLVVARQAAGNPR